MNAFEEAGHRDARRAFRLAAHLIQLYSVDNNTDEFNRALLKMAHWDGLILTPVIGALITAINRCLEPVDMDTRSGLPMWLIEQVPLEDITDLEPLLGDDEDDAA